MNKPREFFGTEADHGHFWPKDKLPAHWHNDKRIIHVIEHTAFEAEKARSAKLLAALEFYADKKNWEERWLDGGEREGDISDVIDRSDLELLEDDDGPYYGNAGVHAREAIKEYHASTNPQPEEK